MIFQLKKLVTKTGAGKEAYCTKTGAVKEAYCTKTGAGKEAYCTKTSAGKGYFWATGHLGYPPGWQRGAREVTKKLKTSQSVSQSVRSTC